MWNETAVESQILMWFSGGNSIYIEKTTAQFVNIEYLIIGGFYVSMNKL